MNAKNLAMSIAEELDDHALEGVEGGRACGTGAGTDTSCQTGGAEGPLADDDCA